MAFQVGMASLEGGLQLLQRLEEEEQPLKVRARVVGAARGGEGGEGGRGKIPGGARRNKGGARKL